MSSASGSPTSTWSQFEEESIYKAAPKGANMDTVALFGISADGLDLSTDSAWITRNSEAIMSSDTNVGLGRRTRLAYCTLAPLVGLFALATPLVGQAKPGPFYHRSEEHTSELQSLAYLVCRLLLEKKKKQPGRTSIV